MRYYIKCKINPQERQRLADSIRHGTLAQGKIFYEGMQTALKEGTIDDNDIVHFIEICYCLEAGLSPMAMEIPVLNNYFNDIIEIKDARLRNQCTMECEFCDCTRNIKLLGKPLVDELEIKKEEVTDIRKDDFSFVDIGRLKLNRNKQKEGIESLITIFNDRINNKIEPVFSGAAISGLFAIFYDGHDYFRVKNIPDIKEARQILHLLGLKVNHSVDSAKVAAKSSLAKNDRRSNVV